MALFKELDCVTAVRAINSIPLGTQGVIHFVYESNEEPQYLVEFLEGNGPYVIDIITVKESELQQLK